MRFSTENSPSWSRRSFTAADRALALELRLFADLTAEVVARAAPIAEAAASLALIDVGAALAELARDEDWVRPKCDDSRVFEIEGGRHPVVEAALRRQNAGAFVANDCDLSPERRLWLVDRSQHGRQIHLPPPERGDHHPGADRRLRSGQGGTDWRGRSPVQPCRRRRRSRPRPFDLHGRDGGDRGDPQTSRRARFGDPGRDRPGHGDLRRPLDSLGLSSSICTRSIAAAPSSPPIITS